tara:strand:+ start:4532 stop:4918 length:387 start_codon:yes stop_codon:yes gene_type:complete
MTLYDNVYEWLGNECGCGNEWTECTQSVDHDLNIDDDRSIYCCDGDSPCIYPLMHRVYLVDKLMQNFEGYKIQYDDLYTDGLKVMVDTWNMKYSDNTYFGSENFDLEGSEGKVVDDVKRLAKFYKGGE